MRGRLLILAAISTVATAYSQQLSIKWEELTAGDFDQAVQKAQGTT
jgi:hypothetical protein